MSSILDLPRGCILPIVYRINFLVNIDITNNSYLNHPTNHPITFSHKFCGFGVGCCGGANTSMDSGNAALVDVRMYLPGVDVAVIVVVLSLLNDIGLLLK